MRGIADLIDSDMENSQNFIDENSILSSASDATSTTEGKQAKRGKKRHRVTMPPKQKAKVAKAVTAPPKKPSKQSAAAKRKALEEHLNDQDRSEDEVVDESESEPQPAAAPATKSKQSTRGPAKPKTNKKAAAVAAAATSENVDDTVEAEKSPAVVRSGHTASRSTKRAPRKPATASKPKSQAAQAASAAVPETPLERGEEDGEEETETMALEKPEKPSALSKGASRNNSRSRQEPPYRRRAGSASDTERGDPHLRRKLGDLTQKLETVDVKYRHLKEVGINEANANMEKVRKQCDAAVQASNELIASLKEELAMQAPLAQEGRKLKKQVQTQELELKKMRDGAVELTSALTTAQNEIKNLTAKLAAARTSSNNAAGRAPGSAMKGKTTTMATTALPGTGNCDAAQIALLKEDLYSDLTGLIIRSVKRTEEGDTYDCIQTGRNGTLQFKLFMDSEDARTTSFDETEFLYTPLLDAHRDREMIELMPTYLTEDITFARQNAAKFYGRVIESLTKRRPEEVME